MKKNKTIKSKGNLIKLSVQDVQMIKGGRLSEVKRKKANQEGDGTGG